MLVTMGLAGVFALAEMCLYQYDRLKKDLSCLLFFLIVFIVGIKYYYGPDIHFYVPLYESIGSVSEVWKNGRTLYPDTEIGYLILCSFFKGLGLSYWGFTLFICLLYFYAIFRLFGKLKSHRSLALFALTVFESSLMYFEFRQCIAVSVFILGVVAFFDKKYIWYALLMILSVFCHKSAIFAVAIGFVSLILPTIKYSRYYFLCLVIMIVLGIFISVGDLLVAMSDILPVSGRTIFSIKHHLEIENSTQIVLGFYLILFISLFQYSTLPDKAHRKFFILSVAFLFCIAIFYKYWFFLNRLRSFFSPLLIVFVINTIYEKQIRITFIRQGLGIALFLLAFALGRGIYLSNKLGESKVLDPTTIFDRLHRSEKDIRDKNIAKSHLYFRKEYLINKLNNSKKL